MGEMINQINYPTVAGGFLNNAIIKDKIHKQVFKGMEICSSNDIGMVEGNDLKP